jgi:exodeoxyribonuclease VII large subunit
LPAARQFRLAELNQAIKTVLTESFDEAVWVVAEIARVNANYSGHTYIDLVEKRDSDLLAQAKATVWRTNNRILTEYAAVTGQPLRAGIQVLLQARVDYHPVYGLSLNVQEIDPGYSLGEMARKRQEVIDRLVAEGLIDRNREQILALVPQRIAVISSATAAGWEDLKSRLENNLYGYGFEVTLITATLQGDGAEASILAALRLAEAADYDAVLIIRGGGGVVDLSCFDSYALSRAVALFPLPVITGIGHERDTSVVDMVAFHRADTPTAAAEYIIGKVADFDFALTSVTERVATLATNLLKDVQLELNGVAAAFMEGGRRGVAEAVAGFDDLTMRAAAAVRSRVGARTQDVIRLAVRIDLRARDYTKEHVRQLAASAAALGAGAARSMERATVKIGRIENTVRLRDPADVLRRGFSITRLHGKAVRSVAALKSGADMQTELQDGTVSSKITG